MSLCAPLVWTVEFEHNNLRYLRRHCREGFPQTRFLLVHSFLAQGEPEVTEFNDFADRSLRPSNPMMVRHYTDSQGKARIQGGKALKASQSYPMKYFGSIGVCFFILTVCRKSVWWSFCRFTWQLFSIILDIQSPNLQSTNNQHNSRKKPIATFNHPSTWAPKNRFLVPRFGRAVARVRSRHIKSKKRAAHRFLRDALAAGQGLDMDDKVSRFWMEHANLQPIFAYLANQWSLCESTRGPFAA